MPVEEHRSRRHIGHGVLVGLGVLILVALPAGWSGFLAVIAFSGCLIECDEPDVGSGVLWAGIAMVLLALPVITGLLVARVSLRRGWPWLAGLAVLMVFAAIAAQRVV